MDTYQLAALEARIQTWKQNFGGSQLTEADVEELAVLLKDTYLELRAANLSDDEAWLVATHRIGRPETVTVQEQKPLTGNANRNWMMMLWGAVGVLILQAIFIVMPQVFNQTVVSVFQPDNSDSFIKNEYYAMAVILFVLFILVTLRSGYFINRFTNSLTKNASLYAIVAIVAGLWAGFCSYITFVKYPMAATINGYSDDTRTAFSVLMFGFYFPLIFVAAFATIRYYARESVTFKEFNRNINWKHALILGLLAQTPIQFSHIFSGSDAVRATVIISLSVLLFSIIGWMLSYSKNAFSTIFAAQIAPLFIWIMGSVMNEQARFIFFIFYITKVIALISSYYIGKTRHQPEVALAQ
ncbi:hypothetical protein LT679_04210 [Mucilaginibacter roseus]|uniref:DUF2157 domain-containing protein n=1 Tax=Mucilaginibacter roseus TaxID=1528868 RepID=A0ABS8TY49_9SPHI|nr:hypothetical protein [Mucilaginibacter roseus]MCD8739796.1 hypothetical protein [Mucilaginibacter roseus]